MTEVVFSELTDEDDPHAELINLINWEEPCSSDQTFVPAFADNINKGVLDGKGNQLPIPVYMFVDDSFPVAIRRFMRRLLNAIIEAIFLVMGRRDDVRRQCHLALDKWDGMTVAHRFIFIGLDWNTRRLTLGITDEYRDELIALIDAPWHKRRNTFDTAELQELIGKVARIGEACRWIFYLLPHLYASVDYALKQNKKFYTSCSSSFRKLLESIKKARHSDIAVANFEMRTAAQRVYRCKKRYHINETMRAEIAAIREIIDPLSGIVLESPIGHLVKRMPTYEGYSDACVYGGGGYSIAQKFWWHVLWPTELFEKTIKFMKGKEMVDINVLEFMSMIINFVGALVALETDGLGDDPWPVMLLKADNKSAIRWIMIFCMSSMAGRALGRIFCFLLIESPLGINAKWIAGIDNDIADVISRLKKEFLDDDGLSNFDYACLPQKFPQLKGCRQFLPSTELLSCLSRAVLTKKSLTLNELRQLKRQGLGKLIS
jgi:hypothetical protein